MGVFKMIHIQHPHTLFASQAKCRFAFPVCPCINVLIFHLCEIWHSKASTVKLEVRHQHCSQQFVKLVKLFGVHFKKADHCPIHIFKKIMSLHLRRRVRISYNWRDLWSTLIALLKFMVANESNLIKKVNVFTICAQVCSNMTLVQYP